MFIVLNTLNTSSANRVFHQVVNTNIDQTLVNS